MSLRSARQRSSTFEHCDTFEAYRQRTWLRPSREHWWAQGWTMPTQFCMECRVRTSTNCNVCKTASPGLLSSREMYGRDGHLKDLHWLLVRYRIDFKIETLVYKVKSSLQPVFLSSLISDYAPIRSLRSTETHILHTPRVKTAVGSRDFSSSVPKVWNSLPADIR